VPRRLFVDEELADLADDDEPIPIGEGQTTSQPLVVATMATALELGPGDRVLEVGAGSGYAAAVMARLAREVHAVEVRPALAARAVENLARAGVRGVTIHLADGRLGWPAAAPYDAISVAAAAPAVPRALVDQLAPGGRLVMPVGAGPDGQRLLRLRREGDDVAVEDLRTPVRFVPLIEGS
jgi:protein-L-isoaspartate(D-aspartate) O-methyltransferase